jgi:hypothetical protein
MRFNLGTCPDADSMRIDMCAMHARRARLDYAAGARASPHAAGAPRAWR